MDLNTWNMFWRLCFGFLATLIVAGNILNIWMFFKLRRRKRSSFLLIGLGVADLLVGGLAIPLFIAAFESASITTWRVFYIVDMFTSTSSIYTLAVISLERMFAVIFIVTVYICANFITSDDSVIYLLVLFPVAPLLVICAAYYVIWRKQKSPICTATFLFLPHFDVICDLSLNRRTATWNLFVNQ